MGRKTFKYDKVLCRKFGLKVTSLRKEKDMTQADLAFDAGISTSYLSAIERGITDTTISTVKRIAKVLNININELFIFSKEK